MESYGQFRTETRQPDRVDPEQTGQQGESGSGIEHGTLPKTDIEHGELSAAGTSVWGRWRVETLPISAQDSFDIDDDTDHRTDGDVPTRSRSTGADGDRATLVQVQLCNPDPVEQRVRVKNQLDGPVLFPRRRGVPESGWNREGFVGTIPATEQRGLGYACPAPVETPPISIEAVSEPTSVDCAPGSADTGLTPTDVVRAYGDGTPPATVISSHTGRFNPRNEREQTDTPNQRDSNAALPPEVTSWLDDVEARVACAEGLQGPTLADATAALVETGGLDPALENVESLPDDAAALRAIAARATALAERAEDVDVPAEALRRVT